MYAQELIRFFAVLDQDDVVIDSYSIHLPNDCVATERDFIAAARAIAKRAQLPGRHPQLRFVIAAQPGLPC
jgi:hypothetical protein